MQLFDCFMLKLFLITQLRLHHHIFVNGYSFASYHCKLPKEQTEAERIQLIVNKCYQNWCRHWILECHWFCDAIRGLKSYERCMGCLGTRGMSCYECFDL